jgi:hypothetical protein
MSLLNAKRVGIAELEEKKEKMAESSITSKPRMRGLWKTSFALK